MPFDPFFSSANKKHYIPVEGASELADELRAMTYEERTKTINAWKAQGFTRVQACALKRMHFLYQGKRWAKVHRDVENRCEQAIQEMKEGKRVFRVVNNFNTVSGARAHSTNHPKGSR